MWYEPSLSQGRRWEHRRLQEWIRQKFFSSGQCSGRNRMLLTSKHPGIKYECIDSMLKEVKNHDSAQMRTLDSHSQHQVIAYFFENNKKTYRKIRLHKTPASLVESSNVLVPAKGFRWRISFHKYTVIWQRFFSSFSSWFWCWHCVSQREEERREAERHLLTFPVCLLQAGFFWWAQKLSSTERTGCSPLCNCTI